MNLRILVKLQELDKLFEHGRQYLCLTGAKLCHNSSSQQPRSKQTKGIERQEARFNVTLFSSKDNGFRVEPGTQTSVS